ncbi:MAG: endonuclease III [Acidimicrobiales bacterium]
MVKPRTPKGRAKEVARRLAEVYPEAQCELEHRNAFELLVATILSAQSTDANVNRVTPALFARFPTAQDLAHGDPAEVEQLVYASGFYKAKTRSILGMANRLVDVYGGEVPGAMADLVSLPGVGRKTANVVRSVALDLPGLPVDTHVLRLTRRLGITTETDPVKIEHEVNAMLPAAELGRFSLRLILHGRRVCAARKPKCADCSLEDICPASQLPTGTRVTRPEQA